MVGPGLSEVISLVQQCPVRAVYRATAWGLESHRQYRLVIMTLAATGAINAGAVAQNSSSASPSVTPMEELVVSAKKLDVETLIDRKVYSVATDVQSSFGSLSDILSVIPSVDVDGTGVVSLRGDTNVLILIDGKPSTQFSGQAAGDNMQSIAAKDIERIEILTTPPAQFKADGAAGVINIITRKHRSEGGSGSAQGSLGNGGRSVVGADSSYSSGTLTASISAGYKHDERHRMIRSDVLVQGLTQPGLSDGSNSLDERIRRGVPTLAISGAYALNDRQSVTGSWNWSERGGLRTYTERAETNVPERAVTTSSQRLSYGHDPERDLDEKLAFTQTLRSSDETLEFALHRSLSHQHEHYDYIDESFLPPQPPGYSNLGFQESHDTKEFYLDYARAFSKSATLKAGYSFSQDDYSFVSGGRMMGPTNGPLMIDPVLTDDFSFRQQIHSLYLSYATKHGAWRCLEGLRAEFARTKGDQLTTSLSTARNYFDFYPSLHVDRTLSESSSLSFGLSRRVTRPDPDTQNPYVDREYTPNLRAGNPNLKPQYSQSYDLGYEYEAHGSSYSVTGYYRLNRDSVTDVTEYLNNGVSVTTKTNLPRNDSAGFEFASSGRIVPKLSYNVSGNFFHSQIDAPALGMAGLQSTTGLNAKIKLDYHPSSGDSAQLTVTRADKKLTPQGYVSAVNIVNLGYKRQLRSEVTAVVTLSDLFNGQRLRRFSALPGSTQEYERTVFGRILYVGVVYSFGTSKKSNPPGFDYDQPSG